MISEVLILSVVLQTIKHQHLYINIDNDLNLFSYLGYLVLIFHYFIYNYLLNMLISNKLKQKID